MATIDTLRFLGAVGVIMLHTKKFFPEKGPVLQVLYFFCELAVPVLLTVSGYLFGKSLARVGNIDAVYWKNLKRLSIVFFGWSLIDILPPLTPDFLETVHSYGILRSVYWYMRDEISYIKPLYFMMTGTAGHLWFISALIQSFTLMTVMLRFGHQRALVYLSLFLFTLMPLVHLYVQLGRTEVYTWNPAVGPFRAAILVVAGWWMSRMERIPPWKANAFLIAGLIVFFTEDPLLWMFYGVKTPFYNYGRALITVGVVMWALIRPNIGAGTWMPRLGFYTLGVYCVHPIVIDIFEPYQNSLPPAASFVWPVLVYAGSLLIAVILSRIPFLKRLAV
jgi:peptidoglycan/LPS O-acetylase OafA/YrhL